MPTAEQAIKEAILCQYLSNYYQPIQLFHFDLDRQEIFILAGAEESIEFIVYHDGNWRFSGNEPT
jgi:hypothetical protein